MQEVGQRRSSCRDTTLRYAIPGHKGMVMGIKQHFVGLQPIGADKERTAVTQLKVGDLQLHPFAGNDRPIFAPVKLEGLTAGANCRGM